MYRISKLESKDQEDKCDLQSHRDNSQVMEKRSFWESSVQSLRCCQQIGTALPSGLVWLREGGNGSTERIMKTETFNLIYAVFPLPLALFSLVDILPCDS